MDFSQYLDNILPVVKKSADLLSKNFEKKKETQIKSGGSYVTDSDKACEELIVKQILSSFPDHSIIAEEKHKILKKNSDFTWYIDPLDGTTNFIYKIPLFAISIALAYKNEFAMGLVYAPMLDELFYALKNKGAYLNNSPIKVNETDDIKKSVIATDFAYIENKQAVYLKKFCKVAQVAKYKRVLGSAALGLCYVGAGRLDAYYCFDLNPWDIAAGALIVKEAKGEVTDVKRKNIQPDSKSIIATNKMLHNQLLTLLN